MLEMLYKALWSRISGRPWTYILRDTWDDYEFFWIAGLVSLGIWRGHNYEWKSVMIGWLLFTAGYIAGHLFWGKDYIPDQPGEQSEDRVER